MFHINSHKEDVYFIKDDDPVKVYKAVDAAAAAAAASDFDVYVQLPLSQWDEGLLISDELQMQIINHLFETADDPDLTISIDYGVIIHNQIEKNEGTLKRDLLTIKFNGDCGPETFKFLTSDDLFDEVMSHIEEFHWLHFLLVDEEEFEYLPDSQTMIDQCKRAIQMGYELPVQHVLEMIEEESNEYKKLVRDVRLSLKLTDA